MKLLEPADVGLCSIRGSVTPPPVNYSSDVECQGIANVENFFQGR
jgi:hypothetical protein